MAAQTPTILVVEDEQPLADMFSEWLESEYEVQIAYDGESALEQADPSINVVLLDRRMPGLSGDEVLEKLRARGLDCPMAMVTAVEPDFDVLDIGFDDYIVKPVGPDELTALVARLLELEEVNPGIKEYFARVSKKNALESRLPETELDQNPEFVALRNEIDAFGNEIISLAEAVLQDNHEGLDSMDRVRIKKELQEWKNRVNSVPEQDPLYQEAKEHVDRLNNQLRQGQSEQKKQLLEAVADGFVAEGFWIDPMIQRALNMMLHNKRDDDLIVNRGSISTAAEEGGAAKFDASKEVRELARNELQRMR